MKSEKLLEDLKEIKRLQQKIERDFLENEKEISKIENEVKELEILDEFAKAIKKIDNLKKEAEIELGSMQKDIKKEKINFEKRI